MTVSLLHKFHSGLADDTTTPGVVHPSDWNNQHAFTGTPGMTVVFDTNGNAAEAAPAAGPPGPAGAIGPAGPTGPQGSTGPAGAQGSQGPAGSAGSQGPPGAVGATGPAGAQGAASTVPGPQGPAGPTGPAGQTAIIVGEFTNQSPSNLPTNGIIPANWDSAGVPPAQITMQLGQALLYTVNQHVWCYVGTGVNAAGWIDLGGAQGPVGPQGPQGVAGPAGATGATGPAGVAGPQGPQGPIGNTGAAGAAGAVGPAGAAGSQGPQGVQGPQGPIGNTGAAGSNGATGPQGPQGPQGVPGAAGQTSILVGEFTNQAPSALPPSGIIPANWDAPGSPPSQITMQAGQAMLYTVNDHIWCYVGTSMVAAGWIDLEGAQGPAGPVGPQGAQGNPGPAGPQGIQGLQGLTGSAGAVGATGATGAAGAQGIQGVAGPAGSTGSTGPQGPQGTAGAAGATGPPGPTAVSTDTGNQATLGSDHLIFVPAGSTGGPGPAGPAGPGYRATSTTSAPIATGSLTITTQAGLAYMVGARLRLSSNSAPTSWMEGLITAYNNSTGSLTVNIDTINTSVAGTGNPGITDGSNAAAGMIGEYLFNNGTVTQPAITGTANIVVVTSSGVASITLTPGDWAVGYTVNTSCPFAYVTSSIQYAGVETAFTNNAGTTATFLAITDVVAGAGLPYPDTGNSGQQGLKFSNVAGARLNVTANTVLSLNATTTLFWMEATFTINAYLWARRVR